MRKHALFGQAKWRTSDANATLCTQDSIRRLNPLRAKVPTGVHNRVGGGITPAVPPHHRTYGSVSRRLE